MTKEPICSCCGKEITGLPLDYSMRLPDNILALPHSEHDNVSQPIKSLISYNDEEFYIRGVIPIEVKGTDDYLVFGVWVEVEEEGYHRAYEAWVESHDKKAIFEGAIIGRLANEFPTALYPDTFNHLLAIFDRPEIAAQCLLKETDHPFSLEQYEGVTIERVHEIARIMGY